ncbi:MAG: hypothetical protein PCFJNLEI_00245 [Verrucomicrobiae bacterium]|nr:hypothetical protein [Verrucomicrobiae bacterium]
MTSTISWDKTGYIINGQRRFLISGEMHYFRCPPADWRRRLELFKAAGGNAIGTYVPWAYHEPTEGQFLFGDKPTRDLEAFLTLCKELDIFVIARPGPYQYSEMDYAGLPAWLLAKYPEVRSRDQQGKEHRFFAVSYLHPTFLEKSRAWFAAVCPILAKYTVARGGPIAFAQFDNELVGIHEWFGGWDYHPVTMGFGQPAGRYHLFLKNRYASIAALNRRYETNFPDFTAVEPFRATPGTPAERNRVRDYHEFYLATVAEYSSTLVTWMREFGFDCDTCQNGIAPANHRNFRDWPALRDRCIVGVDHYYALGLGWKQNNPTPQYTIGSFIELEMLRALGWPQTVYELPAGSLSDWPPITPEDARCCYMLHVAYGMKGFNYYIYTGGVNPSELARMLTDYDYQAPISAHGEIRPLYHMLKSFHQFLNDNAWLAGSERVADLRVGLDWTHALSKSVFPARAGDDFSDGEAWTMVANGLLLTSLCASRSPELQDLSSDVLLQRTDLPLFVAASVCMAADIQQRLIKFVQAGGRLFLAPVIPHLDENFQPCTLLRDFLAAAPATLQRRADHPALLAIGPIPPHWAMADVWVTDELPARATRIGTETIAGKTIGWKKTLPTGGAVIWLGVQMTHVWKEHCQLIQWLAAELGAPATVVECNSQYVWATLRSDGKRSMLFAMNLFSAPMTARVKVKNFDTGDFTLAPMEVRTFLVP